MWIDIRPSIRRAEALGFHDEGRLRGLS